MALTLYTAHVLFIASPLDVYSPVAGYVVQVVAVVLFALGWRATVGRGPLESLVGFVTRRVRRRVAAACSRPGS